MTLSRSPWLAVLPLAFLALTARAAESPAEGVVSLSASASVEAANDMMSVTFSTSRDGSDPKEVQGALKQALDAALAQASQVARPRELEVHTGNFSLFPRHSSKGVITGWSGTTELVVQGRDMQAIAQLTGRIDSMTIARVNYQLSREQREQVESGVTADAIARFRAKAAAVAKAFGYSGYSLREVNVSANEPPPRPVPMMRAQAMAAKTEDALAFEPGKGAVTAVVSGSVQLTR